MLAIIVINPYKKKQESNKEEQTNISGNNIPKELNIDILNSFYAKDIQEVIKHVAKKKHAHISKYLLGKNNKRLDLYSKEGKKEILDKIRPDHKFFKCSFCVGFWVGIILYLLNGFTDLFTFDYHLLNMFLMGFLSSGTSYILDNLIKEN